VRGPDIDADTCSTEGRLAILGRVPFFADLDAAALKEIHAHVGERALQPEDVLYLAGDPAVALYVVAAGEVKLVRYGPEGQAVIVDLLSTGDPFGTLGVLGEASYADSAIAHRQGCVLVIDPDLFAAVLSRHPAVAVRTTQWLARRLDDTRSVLHLMGAGSADMRLAAILLTLADRHGELSEGAILIQVPLSRADLAALAGITQETASRILASWSRQGLVRTGRRWVAVANREALAAMVDAG
jgi:CRP-like cAMP-binding protein